jgi:hypothetical protein
MVASDGIMTTAKPESQAHFNRPLGEGWEDSDWLRIDHVFPYLSIHISPAKHRGRAVSTGIIQDSATRRGRDTGGSTQHLWDFFYKMGQHSNKDSITVRG